MSREIEYRAKNNLGEWVYGHVAVVSLWSGFSVWKIFNDKNGVDGTPIDPKTLGQYTGLKDKNGVKIFEGDVVRTTNAKGVVVFSQGSFIVEWGDYAIIAGDIRRCVYIPAWLENIYVIGNIHEDKK